MPRQFAAVSCGRKQSNHGNQNDKQLRQDFRKKFQVFKKLLGNYIDDYIEDNM